LPNGSFRGCARGGENCGQLFRFVNEIHHSFAKCSLSSFASLANLCMPRDYELLKLLTAKAAKKFREVREEQRVQSAGRRRYFHLRLSVLGSG
jgi:hypothetical protein